MCGLEERCVREGVCGRWMRSVGMLLLACGTLSAEILKSWLASYVHSCHVGAALYASCMDCRQQMHMCVWYMLQLCMVGVL